jgi:hypothetical protein
MIIIVTIRLEAMKGRQNGNPNTPSSSYPAMPQHDEQNQDIQASYSSDNTNDYQTEWNNSRAQRESATSTNMDQMESPHPKSVQETVQPGAWDKIRSENLPNNTWSNIRADANKQPNPSEIEKDRAERFRKLRESSEISAEELPRTREETNKRSARKNQWGDVME